MWREYDISHLSELFVEYSTIRESFAAKRTRCSVSCLMFDSLAKNKKMKFHSITKGLKAFVGHSREPVFFVD